MLDFEDAWTCWTSPRTARSRVRPTDREGLGLGCGGKGRRNEDHAARPGRKHHGKRLLFWRIPRGGRTPLRKARHARAFAFSGISHVEPARRVCNGDRYRAEHSGYTKRTMADCDAGKNAAGRIARRPPARATLLSPNIEHPHGLALEVVRIRSYTALTAANNRGQGVHGAMLRRPRDLWFRSRGARREHCVGTPLRIPFESSASSGRFRCSCRAGQVDTG